MGSGFQAFSSHTGSFISAVSFDPSDSTCSLSHTLSLFFFFFLTTINKLSGDRLCGVDLQAGNVRFLLQRGKNVFLTTG